MTSRMASSGNGGGEGNPTMTPLSSTHAPGATAPAAAGAATATSKASATTMSAATEAPFAASLAEASAGSEESAAASTLGPVYRGSKSGVLSPVQQFESFVLRSFVETMLPQDNTSFFGTGTAGAIWKSMLAERIGDEMARDGGIGIADLLAKRATTAKAIESAKAGLSAADALAVEAGKLEGAGSI